MVARTCELCRGKSTERKEADDSSAPGCQRYSFATLVAALHGGRQEDYHELEKDCILAKASALLSFRVKHEPLSIGFPGNE